MPEEIERLQAENAALRDVLRSLEWAGHELWANGKLMIVCPSCRAHRSDPAHLSQCKLVAALDGTTANALLERVRRLEEALKENIVNCPSCGYDLSGDGGDRCGNCRRAKEALNHAE